jgi:S-adenosyl methyltransferase
MPWTARGAREPRLPARSVEGDGRSRAWPGRGLLAARDVVLELEILVDIGGEPVDEFLHRLEAAVAPDARVSYVDNDHCNSGFVHCPDGHAEALRAPLGAAPSTDDGDWLR